MTEIMKTEKGWIGFKKASRNFRNNCSVGNKLRQPKEIYKTFRLYKRPRKFIYLSWAQEKVVK